MRLRDRVAKLEGQGGDFLGAVWIIAQPGEATEAARARHVTDNGPIGDLLAVVWRTIDPAELGEAACA